MKRRGDEVQFGARAPQRILTTQHSSARKSDFYYMLSYPCTGIKCQDV